jgi:ribosomal protein S18 acetylase RimI-like enzyme
LSLNPANQVIHNVKNYDLFGEINFIHLVFYKFLGFLFGKWLYIAVNAPTMVSIANRTDVEQINQLVNSAYRGDSSRKGWTTEADLLDGARVVPEAIIPLIENPGSVILLYRDAQHQIRGCVNLQEKAGLLYFGMFAVDPNYQGEGIGKKLLYAAEEYARSKGIGVIQMTVISKRDELINWYKKYGFQDTGLREPFPPAHPDSGIPKLPLEFMVLEKSI